MANLKYYLGPWQWLVEGEPGEESGYWSAPAGTRGLVDLRGLVDCALAGGDGDAPFGFFAVEPSESLGLDYLALGQGDLRELQPSESLRGSWQSMIGHLPSGETLLDWLWSQMTRGSDPTYDGPTPPLMPTTKGELELHLGGHSRVKRERFNINTHPHGAMVKDVLRRQFRQHFQDAQAHRIPAEHHRKILDYWCKKYHLNGERDWEQLVPSDLRRHVPGRLKHETVITDDFNRADTNPVSNAAGGWSWTESGGDWSIASNQLQQILSGGNSNLRAESDLSSEDNYSQLDLISGAMTFSSAGPRCRNSASADTCYSSIVWADPSLRLNKRITGTNTALRTDGVTYSLPDTLKVQSDGSTITHFFNGSSLGASTDTAITGHVRCGINSFNGTHVFDNFEAGDLALGGGHFGALVNSSILKSKLRGLAA